MPEHLKVLVVVVAAGVAVFLTGEKIFCPQLVAVEDFRRRRNVWLGVVLVTFLSHNFWVAALLTGLLTCLAAKRDCNPLAVYMTVLLAIPWNSMDIPGIWGINYFLTVNHFKIINIAILLPILLARSVSQPLGPTVRWTDWSIAAYLIYTTLMVLPGHSATSAIREVTDDILTVVLPYLAFSRMHPDRKALQEILIAFILGASVIGLLAPFESLKGWLIYESLREPLGIPPPGIRTYLFRGEEEILRAIGTLEHSIVLGYVMMIGFIAALTIREELSGVVGGKIVLIPLGLGLLFSMARGPWVGFAVGLVTFMLASKGSFRTLNYFILASLLGYVAYYFFPSLRVFLEYIPFIGEVDAGTVNYRQRLLDIGLQVFFLHPFFGAIDYINNPMLEQLRQGQGIIDVVNTYLAVSLAFGVIGLILFLLPFLFGLLSTAHGLIDSSSIEARRLNSAILAILLGVMITIATVSSINAIAPIYWILIAIAVRFGSSSWKSRVSAVRN